MTNKLLVIGFTWPEPNATAAGNRMLQLLHFFSGQDYQIIFSSTASESPLSLNLENMGIQKVPIQLNDSGFDDFIKELQPNIVLFDRFLTEEQFGWRVAEFAPNAIRILDTEDLHSLRKARKEAFKANVICTNEYWLQTDLCKREVASIFRSDVSLIISSHEMQLLKEIIKMDDAILLYLPFMLNPLEQKAITNWKPFEERSDFICIGNGKHAPNIDAIVWLKKEIWPFVQERLPKAKLHVYGAYLPEHVLQMNNRKEGFLVHGWASDISAIMQNVKVNLAPLRFGAGLKGKLITAMQNGTPSVTTQIGAEGLHGHMDFGGIIAETGSAIATAAIELYNTHSLWQTAQDAGVDIIEILYDKTGLTKKLEDKIALVHANLDQHRTKNVIGQLLLHQSMASTKYMSKWIEEKNKKK